jgi:hypothetical protein
MPTHIQTDWISPEKKKKKNNKPQPLSVAITFRHHIQKEEGVYPI